MTGSALSSTASPPELPRHRGLAALIAGTLKDRGLAIALLAAGALYFAASGWGGRPLHRCPFRRLTGLPCPGCGLSRALTLLVRGHWSEAWNLHPFAGYVILWCGMLAGAALLPGRWQSRWAAGWAALETRTRFHTVMLAAFGVHGLARLLWRAWRPL